MAGEAGGGREADAEEEDADGSPSAERAESSDREPPGAWRRVCGGEEVRRGGWDVGAIFLLPPIDGSRLRRARAPNSRLLFAAGEHGACHTC